MDGASEHRHVARSAAVGLVAGVATAVFSPWQLSVLVAWDVTVVVFLGWLWLAIWGLDSTQTARRATREDNSRAGTTVLLLSAAVASLIGVALAAIKAKASSGAISPVLQVAGVATVVFSWALVHSLYTLRYARLYYGDDPGGIDFKTDEPPDYRDFAYVAFTVGMTFQVSDTDIQLPAIRRNVLRHALLSYLFGVVIIALVINVIAGLVK